MKFLPRYDVLCIGSAVLDRFMQIEEPFSKIKLGDKILVQQTELHSGGSATNSAAAFSKLGLNARMLTKLGKDHDADFILKEMQQYHVRNICRNHSRQSTNTSSIISSTKEKDRVIFAYKGASETLHVDDFPKSYLNVKWFYLGSLTGKSFAVAKYLAEFAQKKGIKLLFNPSLYLAEKGPHYLSSVLSAANILVLNKEEAQALARKKVDSRHLLSSLHNLGPETVVITDGPGRIWAWHRNIIYSILPPKVKVVHTAGSGDAFTSALLAGIIKGYSFAEALKLGLVNSLSVIQHLGTKNKLLNLSEARKMISKYKLKVNIDASSINTTFINTRSTYTR